MKKLILGLIISSALFSANANLSNLIKTANITLPNIYPPHPSYEKPITTPPSQEKATTQDKP